MKRLRSMSAALAAVFAASSALAETWTFQTAVNGIPSGNPVANYAAANAWKDENGVSQTFDENTTDARTYLVPAGKTLIGYRSDTDAWRFTQNADTFILEGSETQEARLYSSSQRITIPTLVMRDNSRFVLAVQSDVRQTALGTMRVEASVDSPAKFQHWDYAGRNQTNAMTVVGTGALTYIGSIVGGAANGTRGNLVLYPCDASGFTGPVTMKMDDAGTGRAPPNYYVNHVNNIGGNPSAFTQKGLALAGVYLEFQGNVTLPANRGLYIGTHPSSEANIAGRGANIGVAGGRTFAVTTPVVFESADFALGLTAGSGAFSLPGWTSNGTILLASRMTLDITGASVASGAVSPASIGTLKMTSGTVRLTLSGDGSELADGQYVLLTAASRLPDAFSTLTPVVNGAFTLPAGKKAMYSVLNGMNFVMTVKDDCPTWTFTSTNTGNGNYAVANAWTDENGTTQTLASGDTTARDYIIPGGKTLKTPNDSSVNWSFTSGDGDTFILKGTSSSEAKMESRVADLNVGYLRMLDHSNLSLSEKGWASVRGTISVEASEAYPAIFFLRNWQSQHQTNETTIVGSGALVYTHPASTYNENILFLKGDASGFTGALGMKGIDGTSNTTQSNSMRRLSFAFSSGANIAGNPATFLEKGLVLGGVRLLAQGDASLGMNRGLYISRNFTNDSIAPGSEICVKSGCTFAIPGGVSFEDSDYPLILTSKNTPRVGGGTLSVPGWAANGTIKVTTGTLEITGASVAEGVVTPATVGKLEMSGDATVKLAVAGDGSELPLANATNVLLVAEGALPADFAGKVQLVGDNAFTVPSRLKTRLVVVDGTKLALETEKDKGFVLIVK